jgi:cytochrome c2
MWNHRADMIAASEAKGAPTPKLEVQDLSDMLVYLRNLPDNRSKTGVFRIEMSDNGQSIFEATGCAKCHQSVETLAERIEGETLTEISVAMWNHATRMAANGAPMGPLAPGQMQALVSAFWAAKFFGKTGRPSAGAGVFTAKGCAGCHSAAGGAPQLPFAEHEFTAAAMVAVLWKHGPTMLDQMKAKGTPWPHFDGTQMADLIAYLNTKR